MKTISFKIDQTIFKETEDVLKYLKTPRNRYFNEAIQFYNKFHNRKLLENRLMVESKLVASNSLKTLLDFESLKNETMFLD